MVGSCEPDVLLLWWAAGFTVDFVQSFHFILKLSQTLSTFFPPSSRLIPLATYALFLHLHLLSAPLSIIIIFAKKTQNSYTH